MNGRKWEDLTLDELLEQLHTLEKIEENIPIEKLLQKFPEIDKPFDDEKGVLSAKYIKKYSQEHKLIFPFNENRLKGASYILDVGNEYAIQGISDKLTENTGKNEIKIDPFQVAIIKTRQIINMPRFLIGRWNIKVSRAYEGLLWVGGPQVDPGWIGHLYCPVYNLSNKTIVLRLGEELATIDFVRASDYDIEYKEKYIKRPPKRTRLEHYKPVLQSALYTEAAKRIDKIEERASRVEGLIIGPIFTSIAITIALIGILLVNLKTISSELLIMLAVSLSVGLSIGAISIAIIYKGKSGTRKQTNKNLVLLLFLFGLILGSIGTLFIHSRYSLQIEQNLKKIQILQDELQRIKQNSQKKDS